MSLYRASGECTTPTPPSVCTGSRLQALGFRAPGSQGLEIITQPALRAGSDAEPGLLRGAPAGPLPVWSHQGLPSCELDVACRAALSLIGAERLVRPRMCGLLQGWVEA